jgi:hypothetical protein
VYLYFEKSRKYELEQQRRDAMTMANALVYATPVGEKSDLRKKQQTWEKFINSLDIDYVKKKEEKPKQTVGDVRKMFGGLGMKIPMITPKQKGEN